MEENEGDQMKGVEETETPEKSAKYVEKVEEPQMKLEQPQNEAPAADGHPPTIEPTVEMKVSPPAKLAYFLWHTELETILFFPFVRCILSLVYGT